MKKTSQIKKLYNSRSFWVVISVLLSLAMWVYVTSVESDEFQQTFRGVHVEVVGEDALKSARNMEITDVDTSTVTVVVTGPRRIVGMLDEDDLVAQIDVSKLSQAAYTSLQYEVVFPAGVDTSKINIDRKTPQTIGFMVSKLSTKTVQVRGAFEGALAEGFTAETPVFEPSTIIITGPESYLKDVSYAWVSFGKDLEVSSTYSVETGFTLLNDKGEACSTTYLTSSADTITATLPMLEVKDVTLGIDVMEGAGATKSNIKVKIEPESITLAGDSSILSGVNRIVLGTIDLTDFASTFTETYLIPIDNNLRNLTGITEAKVTVEVLNLETKTFKVRNISCINLADGTELEVLTESIDIVIRGTAEQLAQIKSENIRVVADLTDYKGSTGAYMPVVKIYVDGYTDVGAIGEYTISVEIRKA